MSDSSEIDQDETKPFTPSERKIIREMLQNYEHSLWLFTITMKVAKWFAAVVAAFVAYKHLPFIPGSK